VLAAGCAGPAAPADPRSAAVTTYRMGKKVSPPRARLRGEQIGANAELPGLDLARLTAVACQPSF
jgi:hypothetical protein